MIEVARKPVKISVTRNPLRFDEVEEYSWPYMSGVLSRYIPDTVTVDDNTVIRQNGHVIARERWGSRPVGAGDHIQILAVPGGLGALIAASFGAAFATSSMTAAGVAITTLTTLGTITAIAIDLTISLGLSYLSSLLVDQPKLPDIPESPTYGAGGVRTTQINGAVLPIHYGKGRLGGNIIRSTTGHSAGSSTNRGSYTASIGGSRTNIVQGLCEGPVYSVGGITTDQNSLWFGIDGSRWLVYNGLGRTHCCTQAIKGPGNAGGLWRDVQKVAILAVVNGEHSAFIDQVRLRLKKFGTITSGKVITVTVQAADSNWYYGVPSGTNLIEPIEFETDHIPVTGWKDFLFELDSALELAPTPHYYWIVIEGDWDFSTSNYVGLSYASSPSWQSNIMYYDGAEWSFLYKGFAIAEITGEPEKYLQGAGEIKINGSAIEAFTADGYVSVRRGEKHQEALPGSSDITIETPVDMGLPHDREIEYSTSGEVDGFGIVVSFPRGFYRVCSEGKRRHAALTLEFRYRVTGEEAWAGKFRASESLLELGPTANTYRVDLPTEKNSQNPIARGNALDIEVKRITPIVSGAQEVKWKSIKEYNDEQAQSYPHVALLQTDLDVGTSQGAVDNITTLVQGKIVKVYDPDMGWSDQYSTNPAWCCLDLYLNRRYGGGRWYKLNNVDLTEWKAWADGNDVMIKDGQGSLMKRWEIGYTIDQPRPLRDHLAQIAACSRTKLVDYGNKLVPVPDVACDSVMEFNPANTGVGSFRTQFIGKEKRPNKVTVRFFNEDLDYAEDYATVADPSIHVTGTPEIEEVVDRTGITKPARARREAKYLLNQAKRIGWISEWDSFIGAVGCQPGQVVELASDLWETVGGRLKENAAGVNSVVLDRDITIDTSGDEWEIRVDDGTMSDAIQTRTILESPGTYAAGDTIDITPSWTSTPQEGWHWSAGPVRSTTSRATRKAKVVSMEIGQDFRVHLKGVQYDARVYDDYPGHEDPVPTVPERSPYTIPPRVKDLALRFEQYGVRGKARVLATWTKAVWPFAYRCQVWARPVGTEYNDRFTKMGDTENASFEIENVVEDQLYQVAVVTVAPGSGSHANPASGEANKKHIYVQRPMDPMRKAQVSSAVF